MRRLRDLRRRALRRWEGERILRNTYRDISGRDLDVRHPQGFSEKLFRRMVLMNRSRSTEFTALVDKFQVREHVARVVGDKYLTTLHWHGVDPAKIPFRELPDRYVIKTNHASGQTITVSGPIDEAAVVQQLRSWLKQNYYWVSREYQYFDVHPRILVEELLDDGRDNGPLDYRLWCFDGTPVVIQVADRRHDLMYFVDPDWNPLDLDFEDFGRSAAIERPENLAEMREVAAALARGIDFVRVDLYNVHGRIVFGEMTFTPRAGRFRFTPSSWDAILGAAWTVSGR